MHPKQYHEHKADLPCVRPECDQFTRHRIHPFPVPEVTIQIIDPGVNCVHR